MSHSLDLRIYIFDTFIQCYSLQRRCKLAVGWTSKPMWKQVGCSSDHSATCIFFLLLYSCLILVGLVKVRLKVKLRLRLTLDMFGTGIFWRN